jgi:hypothetical protein
MQRELNIYADYLPYPVQQADTVAGAILNGINNRLWLDDKKYYGQFAYGRNFKTVSPRAEALGEALTILFNIADATRAKEIVHNAPITAFGIPCIYPQIPNIPPYHNNATWPFVQSYWTMACAKADDEAAVKFSLDAIYRPTALFLTNKENFVSSTGDYVGTQINSDNMLWSLSGNIAMVYKVLFGIEFQANALNFHPFVPKAYGGKRSLNNFKYRDAVLDISMDGYGNKIKSFFLDGEQLKSPVIQGNLKGKHNIVILLENNFSDSHIHLAPSLTSPETPSVKSEEKAITWTAVEGAMEYKVIRNGERVAATKDLRYPITENGFGEYQVIAVAAGGAESFASEPLDVAAAPIVVELETSAKKAKYPYKGFSGDGFVEVSKTVNKEMPFKVTIPEKGLYAISFRYANGNGPINTENKCAIRSLKIGNTTSTFVFPHRGTGEWSDWGYTNIITLEMEKGEQECSLQFMTDNMNGEINQAMIDAVRFIKIK